MKKTLGLFVLTLIFFTIGLVFLKVWRSQILAEAKIIYIPSQIIDATSGVKRKINIVLQHDSTIEGITKDGKIKLPESEKLKAESSEFLKYKTWNQDDAKLVKDLFVELGPKVESLALKNYWANDTNELQIIDGIFDRLDDFSFWNTVGVMLTAALLYHFCRDVINDDKAKSLNLLKFRTSFKYIGVVLSFLFCFAMWKTHSGSEKGPLHGGFYTLDYIPGIKFTQQIDFVLFCAVAIMGGLVAAIMANILFNVFFEFVPKNEQQVPAAEHTDLNENSSKWKWRAKAEARSHKVFENVTVAENWRFFINSGFISLWIILASYGLVVALAPYTIPVDVKRLIITLLAYQTIPMIVGAVAFFLTSSIVKCSAVDFPFLLWVTTSPKLGDPVLASSVKDQQPIENRLPDQQPTENRPAVHQPNLDADEKISVKRANRKGRGGKK